MNVLIDLFRLLKKNTKTPMTLEDIESIAILLICSLLSTMHSDFIV